MSIFYSFFLHNLFNLPFYYVIYMYYKVVIINTRKQCNTKFTLLSETIDELKEIVSDEFENKMQLFEAKLENNENINELFKEIKLLKQNQENLKNKIKNLQNNFQKFCELK